MLKNALHFIKYNNLTIIILLGLFLVSSSVFAQTETGQNIIGGKQVTYQGLDNTLLLQADLDNLDMDFKIEGITQDEKYYYVTYTFINLEPINNAWQYQLRENKRKVSRKLRMDLGKYLAEQLKQEYDERVKELKEVKQAAGQDGKTQAVEVEEYTGLIGKTLEIAGNIFPGYEPVKKTVLPSPSLPNLLTNNRENVDTSLQANSGTTDNLTDIYKNYISENDPDQDNIFGAADNCPLVANSDQTDSNGNGVGDACEPDMSGVSGGSGDQSSDSQSSDQTVNNSETSSSSSSEISSNTAEGTGNTTGTSGVTETQPEVQVIDLPVTEAPAN